MMDPDFDIPKPHSPRRALKLVLMIGIAALLFFLAATPLVQIASALGEG